jgi:hypothetical protein
MLLLIIVLLLLFGGGGGYYGYSRWGARRRFGDSWNGRSDRGDLVRGRRAALTLRASTESKQQLRPT